MPNATGHGFHSVASGMNISAQPNSTYESAQSPTRCTAVNVTESPPRYRCRSSSHAGDDAFATAFVEMNNPQATDRLTSAQAMMPLDLRDEPPHLRTHDGSSLSVLFANDDECAVAPHDRSGRTELVEAPTTAAADPRSTTTFATISAHHSSDEIAVAATTSVELGSPVNGSMR